MTAPPLTLGTAGHIDHGKTALIRALTGVDTDRLPEERTRGISIELGYASLELPSGRRLSVVDVPGHERFVRTMVAGATGIDLFLMTIAADDGVMPQTREHAAVLRALRVRTGVVAVTKSDLADPEVALIEASELFPGSEAVAVSARTGAGLDELRSALDRASAELDSARRRNLGGAAARRPRVHDPGRRHGRDRHAVVRGDRARRRARAAAAGTAGPRPWRAGPRSAARSGAAGQRVAVNLTGVAVDEIERGDVLVGIGSKVRPSYRVDAELEFATTPSPSTQSACRSTTARARRRRAWRGSAVGSGRSGSSSPIVAAAGDRLVVRRIAPPDTLGGGARARPAAPPARPEPRPARPARAARPRRGSRRTVRTGPRGPRDAERSEAPN